jgi:ABC-type nitrate/sulfonate/bicarbonate transport system substrate-binding protein/outer membrane protein OmpA-like peptidoglycan-associated protein
MNSKMIGYVLLLGLIGFSCVFASQELLTPAPLSETVKKNPGSVTGAEIQIPLITWGADVATIYAQEAGLFKKEGLAVSLVVENEFPKQVEMCLSGKTPLLRGTLGMIHAAAEVFKKRGIDLQVIYQLSWSVGGDALVVRNTIKKPEDLINKTIALQLYGPHMDYLANVLKSANIPLSKVNLKWFRNLTLPEQDTKGKIIDPVSAFLNDNSIDAVLCIIPDAMNLTSGGSIGTGAAGSVKGAKIMLSTKTASRIISDVYAIRSDYLAKEENKIKSLVRVFINAEKSLQKLLMEKAGRQKEYKNVMEKSAELLFGAAQAVPDVEALLGDCEFAGLAGNIQFFSGRGTTRTLNQLNSEIQNSFINLKLIQTKVPLNAPKWDLAMIMGGIAEQTPQTAQIEKKRFDPKKVEKKISVESTSWAEEGTLFQIEINFEPNQSDFTEIQYADDFEKAVSIAQTYGGALIIVEGHSDPLGILKARKENRSGVELAQMEQQSKNLSLSRAQAVRESFLKYCKNKNLQLDASQFVAVGRGIVSPKYNPPRTKEEWAANRRVVFRIKQVEAELSDFSPVD